MEIQAYTELIKHLPYKEQSFETQQTTWNKYRGAKFFSSFYKKTFKREVLCLSRGDLFDLCNNDSKAAILSIILWGYPRNMRGNSFEKVLQHLDAITTMMEGEKDLTEEAFLQMCKAVAGKGIGLSTLSNFLYFFNFKVEGCRCLILDSRIISVLQEGGFAELSTLNKITDINKAKYYKSYVAIMSAIANAHNYTVDQLELFLFVFGNNLKSSNE